MTDVFGFRFCFVLTSPGGLGQRSRGKLDSTESRANRLLKRCLFRPPWGMPVEKKRPDCGTFIDQSL